MRILIVEDEKQLALSIAKNLKTENFAVDIAEDGITAEEMVKINSYDVVILDIMLPLQDGWQTCKNLRKDGYLVPIIMLTALDDVNDRIKGFDTGADDYLPKPFHFGELLARIRSLIRRNSYVRSNVIEKFGIKLCYDNYKVYRQETEILLSAKEFSLLELFMLNPNKILSREAISEHLWDINFNPRSNVIDSFVKLLRNKMDKNYNKPLIHTVRGVGYIFCEDKCEN